jgi:hypothetical protein
MMPRILGSFLMLSALGAALTTVSDASAGAALSTISLTTNANFSGSVSGSFQAFRNNADPNAFISFQTVGGNIIVGALNGTQFSCAVPTSLTTQFNAALLSRSYFSVAWNTSGTCTSILVKNSSEWGSY